MSTKAKPQIQHLFSYWRREPKRVDLLTSFYPDQSDMIKSLPPNNVSGLFIDFHYLPKLETHHIFYEHFFVSEMLSVGLQFQWVTLHTCMPILVECKLWNVLHCPHHPSSFELWNVLYCPHHPSPFELWNVLYCPHHPSSSVWALKCYIFPPSSRELWNVLFCPHHHVSSEMFYFATITHNHVSSKMFSIAFIIMWALKCSILPPSSSELWNVLYSHHHPSSCEL